MLFDGFQLILEIKPNFGKFRVKITLPLAESISGKNFHFLIFSFHLCLGLGSHILNSANCSLSCLYGFDLILETG